MTWTRISISLAAAAVGVSMLIATLTIWLLFTSPATVAEALDRGAITPMARELAAALIDALRSLLSYL